MSLMKYLGIAMLIGIVGSSNFAVAQEGSTGPRIRVGVDASEWSSSTVADPANGILPIGGSGQLNGEFTVARIYGIEIGLRAQKRFFGPIVPTRNGDVGVYDAEVGESQTNRAKWNYDFHIDLRNARGPLKNKTLDDFNVYLKNNLVGPGDVLFGQAKGRKLNLKFDENTFPAGVVLYQNSLNPNFGNTVFDEFEARNYRFELILEPKGEGQPISVEIKVRVR